jgi:hypothetical protein
MSARFLSAQPLVLLVLTAASLHAQAANDGLTMPKKTLGIGMMYTHESWNEYWEGTLKRSNGNIGAVTTQSSTLVGFYGLTDRLTLISELPYVWTHASQGPLNGFSGLQDFTFAAKYRLLAAPFTQRSTLTALVVGEAGIPVSSYTPDFLPLSIGLASRRASGRFTLHFESTGAWFIDGSAARTWRNKVNLDRGAYYTNGQLYLTNQVAMPGVIEWSVSAGFRKARFFIPVSFVQQRTLGGGDIRRQDMPFVSNRMDFTRLGASVMYGLTVPTDLAIQVGASRVLSGRNVGQATTIMAGLAHTFHF